MWSVVVEPEAKRQLVSDISALKVVKALIRVLEQSLEHFICKICVF